jgi:hypothetical protein
MISFKIKLHMRHIKYTSLVMRDLELFLSQLTLIYLRGPNLFFFSFFFSFLFGRIMQVLMWRQHKQTKMNKIKKNKFNNNLRAGAHDFYSSDRESSSRPIRKLLSLSPIDLNSHTPFLLSQNDICYHWPVRVDFPPFSLQIPP